MKSAVRGAFAGGILSAADVGFRPGTLPHVVAKSVAGGLAAEIQGGKFSAGFSYFAATSGSRYVYNSITGADVTPESGVNTPDQPTYEFNRRTGRPLPEENRRNFIGFHDELGQNPVRNLFTQSQGGSRMLNAIPGANAVARLDDTLLQRAGPGGGMIPFMPGVAFTIPFALGVTTAALYDRIPMYRPLGMGGRI